MQIGALVVGILIVIGVLWDTFETIVMPKTVRRRLSLTAFFYRVAWRGWAAVVKRMRDGPRRVAVLGAFGPLSLILLMATWALLMVAGFGFIHFGAGTLDGTPNQADFGTALYFSGTTFFTLGFGDVTPIYGIGRFLAVTEAGSGFGFLAVIISYFPVLYQAFSRRENLIVLLDSKAGSDPSAGELLRRHAEAGTMDELIELLHDWEVWSAQQLETFLSYPIMAYYRSQHDDQSWLCALTAILDTCSIIDGGFEGEYPWEQRLVFQAQATFAMARHVVVDLAYLLNLPPTANPKQRYAPSDWAQLKRVLEAAGMPLDLAGEARIDARRELYEPYVVSLARALFFVLPSWVPEPGAVDNWQTTAWDIREHF
ncbi:MAG: potassium channel family protein [Fimbriimonadaceae bacterium]